MNRETTDPALVSVVLPTYNRAPLLAHAIRSVLNQTHANIELIVVDDNSGDHTPDVVRSFADERIRYIRNEHNLKLPRGLNRGFEASRGAYLTWTSDDNYFAPQAIEQMVAVLGNGGCDFVYSDYFHFSDLDESGTAPADVRRVCLPHELRLDQGNAVGACFLYTRRVYETIGGYDPDLFLVEDYDYWIRIAQQFRICHIAEPLYYFRRHDDALFCSRYAEVKAADILVRVKNGLLDNAAALRACSDLVARPEALRSSLLRGIHARLARVSFRLTQLYGRFVRAYVAWRLGPMISPILDRFISKSMSFRDSKDALCAAMLSVTVLEYK